MTDFPFKHIIWDWNGTLLDDAGLCVATMNDLLAKRNLPPLTPARYETIFDFPVIDYYRKVGFDFERESFEHLSDAFISIYEQRVRQCSLREGAREALELGRRYGLTQSILSAMKQEMLDDLLAHFGLVDYFTDVVGIRDHHAFGKTETARQWMETQRLDPAEVVFVGDTTHDSEVAQVLGVQCYMIYSGHHSRERLATTGAASIDLLTALFDASQR